MPTTKYAHKFVRIGMIKNIYNNIFSITIYLLFTLFLTTPLYAQNLLVHKNLSISSISQDKLRAIYSMRTRVWSDGTPITVFILNPDSAVHRDFCLKKLEIFPYQLQRVWDVKVYSGTGQTPINLNSEAEMIRKISKTPGAIGYISDKGVTDNVKIIDIQK